MVRTKGDSAEFVIGVDPGRNKCGLAVLNKSGQVIMQKVTSAESLIEDIQKAAKRYSPAVIVMGDRTGSHRFRRLFQESGVDDLVQAVVLVSEHLTSQEARCRYLARRRQETGNFWHRIIPLGMQVPDKPYDDYVAVILAERYLKESQGRR